MAQGLGASSPTSPKQNDHGSLQAQSTPPSAGSRQVRSPRASATTMVREGSSAGSGAATPSSPTTSKSPARSAASTAAASSTSSGPTPASPTSSPKAGGRASSSAGAAAAAGRAKAGKVTPTSSPSQQRARSPAGSPSSSPTQVAAGSASAVVASTSASSSKRGSDALAEGSAEAGAGPSSSSLLAQADANTPKKRRRKSGGPASDASPTSSPLGKGRSTPGSSPSSSKTRVATSSDAAMHDIPDEDLQDLSSTLEGDSSTGSIGSQGGTLMGDGGQPGNLSAGSLSLGAIGGDAAGDVMVGDDSGGSSGSAGDHSGAEGNNSLHNSLSMEMSDAAPLILTSTVSRGTFHQCGTARRVKVYELRDGNWHDKGTGYCAGVYDEQQDEALLCARSEDKCHVLEMETVEVLEGEGGAGGSGGDGTPGSKVQLKEEMELSSLTEGVDDRKHYVLVVNERLDEEQVLLKSKVVREDVYQRQQDTLIVWTEPNGVDTALSFQEQEGCQEIWEFVTEVQKHFMMNAAHQAFDGSPPSTPNPDSPSGEPALMEVQDGPLLMSDGTPFALPEPSLQTLETIEMTLKSVAGRPAQVREKVAEWILKNNFLPKLLPCFADAEDLEALDALHRLCVIAQTILLLNDNVILEHILQDDLFLGVIGMLEYDPEFPQLKASYRDYLTKTTKYRQVVEIDDPVIVTKIHQTYRLQYLKDVILARCLDDPMFSVLSSFVFFHQVDIVTYCSTSEPFLQKLFGIWLGPQKSSQDDPDASSSTVTAAGEEPGRDRKRDGVFFLQQLCSMGKQIQLPARMQLYRTLVECGLLTVLEWAMCQQERRLRNAAAEILLTIIEYDANSVRLHVLEQVEQGSKALVTSLTDLLHVEQDLGLKSQMTEAMRVLFDSGPDGQAAVGPAAAQAMAGQAGSTNKLKDDTDRFLTWFYESDVDHLFSPLLTLPAFKTLDAKSKIDLAPRDKSALFGHLCDLLCFIVTHHDFRSQHWLITSEISRHAASLLFAKEKHVRLSAVRLFRACLTRNNQFINRHLVKLEVLGAVLIQMELEGRKDNLVSSACLDLFEYMRRENMKPLILHLVPKYRPRLKTLSESPLVGSCFAGLLLQFDKYSEPAPPGAAEGEASTANVEAERERRQRDLARRGGNRATMDLDEESYFNDDDDETEGDAPSASQQQQQQRSGLVPYTDDAVESEEPVAVTLSLGGAGPGPGSASGSGSSPSRAAKGLGLPKAGTSAASDKKRRAAQDEEDDDLVGRLAKRRSSGSGPAGAAASSGSGGGKGAKARKEEEQEEGGFIRETPVGSGAAGSTNGGAKKISLALSSQSVKLAEEGSAVPAPVAATTTTATSTTTTEAGDTTTAAAGAKAPAEGTRQEDAATWQGGKESSEGK